MMKGCLAFFSEAPCELSQTRRRLLQMSDFGALLTSFVRMLHCKSILRAMPGVDAGPAPCTLLGCDGRQIGENSRTVISMQTVGQP